MIIVFANQKGGCGKTTNCIQFANYLVEKGIDALVLDLDFQRSILDRREEDINTYDNPPKYEVINAKLSEVAALLGNFESVDEGNLLIDLPGKIDDDALGIILKAADIIVCPFKYDKLTMDSTGFFIKITQHLNVKAKLFFLPNNINKSVRYEAKEATIKVLQSYGYVTKEVPSRVMMERVNTLTIGDEAISVVKEAYDFIIQTGEIK